MTTKQLEIGIDYLRLTSGDSGAKARMIDYFCAVAARDQQLGYDVGKGGAFGFYGQKTRHALYGDKKEWSMLQVSGYEAKRGIILAHEGTQCSRLDLQMTVFVGEDNVTNTIRTAYQQACQTDRPEARHMKVTCIESRGKIQTVYLGSRASDIFFRIYDKFAESGKEEYRGCVRYELEIKGRASKALWRKLISGEITLFDCFKMLQKMLLERGVLVPVDEIKTDGPDFPRREKTRTEATAAWLASQVAPTVRRLTDTHGWMYCFSMLFHLACSDEDKRRILRSLALNWGS